MHCTCIHILKYKIGLKFGLCVLWKINSLAGILVTIPTEPSRVRFPVTFSVKVQQNSTYPD